jgi:hypothetical protein
MNPEEANGFRSFDVAGDMHVAALADVDFDNLSEAELVLLDRMTAPAEQAEQPTNPNELLIADIGKLATAETAKAVQKAAIRRDGRKPKAALEAKVENPTPKGGRGNFHKHLRTQLTRSGKINAKEALPTEQKRLRKRKRK